MNFENTFAVYMYSNNPAICRGNFALSVEFHRRINTRQYTLFNGMSEKRTRALLLCFANRHTRNHTNTIKIMYFNQYCYFGVF